MNRDDCEKLLDAFENAAIATRLGTSESMPLAKAAREDLRDVIVGIMADGKKPVYRDGGITVGGLDWGKVTAVPAVGRPVVTCDGMAKEGE